ITGLSPEAFTEAAKRFINADSRLIALTVGAAENQKGYETVVSAANLLMLLGEGPDALQVPSDYSNTLGAWLVGTRPAEGGKDLYEMLYNPGSLKALYVMGEDPVVTMPEANTIKENLEGLEFLVVQDIRLSETAKLADVVLPAAAWSEKEGTFINSQGIPQPFPKVVSPAGDAVPDWQILRNLARVMEHDLGVIELNTLREEIASIEVDRGQQKWRYRPVTQPQFEFTHQQYPILMVTGNIMQHSGALSVMSKSLSHVLSDAFVQISPEDAKKYNISDGEFIKITSPFSEVFIKARVSDEIPEGMLFVPVHFAHARVNSLVSCPKTGTAHPTPVKIEPSH
ncbi:MAG: hypothetical protein D6710_02620, partial [Nitrospirae bacterium]